MADTNPPSFTGPRIVPLDRAHTSPPCHCGPKAVSLGRLIGHGLPVPPGFCITTVAWREHLDVNRLAETIRRLLDAASQADPEHVRRHLAALRRAVVDAPVPERVRHEIETHYRSLAAPLTAVRSSATAEDMPGQSFAGQHETVLGVRDAGACVAAVKRCWSSLWSDRAFQYRTRQGVDHGSSAMAVIVQALVPADASGVIFTADPITGGRDRITIESTIGLGEPLVSGQVTPDRVVVSRHTSAVVDRRAGPITVARVADPAAGVVDRALPDAPGAPSLDDAMAVRVARLALDAEQVFGHPVDVEFAVADGRPFLVQARPVTTLPARAASMA